ncbi:HCP-like superfamily protein with MYND-type zinc finger [Dorcoceras hygrometricum]|uniref:HCP-like superfamily protein with MYND-type zinc finger n=1 Tax=Dorcoceras hygrometricum TaxID=472368 RepID=A0A2Z7C6E6_9LAMI|nr:HCP-like superfamily protein with MYND-type zinc finger [Dorcoceras hygrometricum]
MAAATGNMCVDGGDTAAKRKREEFSWEEKSSRKKLKGSAEGDGGGDLFDALPDDIVHSILCKLSSTAGCPEDFINVLITCKRLNSLGLQPMVLSKSSHKMLAIKAKNWSESARRFLVRCVESGSVEASFILGMILFYCFQNRGEGVALIAKAAITSHAAALYSLAVIQFNGSGGSKNNKDLRAGVALCSRAAFLGHVDAMRELGHCFQDGYGVSRNIMEGRRLLLQANARELALVITATPGAVVPRAWLRWSPHRHLQGPLMSDFGCNVPAAETHPANQFLYDWFSSPGREPGPDLRLCSNSGCGRPETRMHEFRRCSVCGTVNYCSRACQALDWKYKHKADCGPHNSGAAINRYGDLNALINLNEDDAAIAI